MVVLSILLETIKLIFKLIKYGELGLGDKNNRNLPTLIFNETNPISRVICGDRFSYILFSNTSVYSFGKNTDGQLSLGNTIEYNVPKQVPFFNSTNNMIEISCASSHCLFLLNNGDLYGSGSNQVI
jgi:alpha-tubulin suppressor-like RCC1 family protein